MSLSCAAWLGTHAFNTTWAPGASAMLTAEWKQPTL